MSVRDVWGEKKDSTLVTVLCGFALAISFLGIAGAFIPFLDKVAVLISALSVAIGSFAIVIALIRDTRLVLPALTLIIAAIPAGRENYLEMGKVWVESAELCQVPGAGHFSVFTFIGDVAEGLQHRKVVGSQICAKLGKHLADDDCDGPVGRIKCEL